RRATVHIREDHIVDWVEKRLHVLCEEAAGGEQRLGLAQEPWQLSTALFPGELADVLLVLREPLLLALLAILGDLELVQPGSPRLRPVRDHQVGQPKELATARTHAENPPEVLKGGDQPGLHCMSSMAYSCHSTLPASTAALICRWRA